ncbi:MAG: hypothetical protein QF805_10720, partial [Pirellulaceae bacterium]|nr:hypothetical protein [Pirellulaceae bacterium]
MAPIFDRRQLMALAAIAAGDLCRVASAQSTSSRAGTWPDERQIGSFLAHADFDLGKVERTLQQTGALRWDLERTLHVGPPREAINLFLFEREETFRAYVRLYFPDVPQRRALYIKNSRGPGMVFAHLHKEFAVDVRHECTHALLHAALPMVPLWLDEGIAEYFEAPADKRVYDNEHFGKLRWRAKVGSAKNIESLET